MSWRDRDHDQVESALQTEGLVRKFVEISKVITWSHSPVAARMSDFFVFCAMVQ